MGRDIRSDVGAAAERLEPCAAGWAKAEPAGESAESYGGETMTVLDLLLLELERSEVAGYAPSFYLNT